MMEPRAEYNVEAPLSIAEERQTYVREDGTTFTRADIHIRLHIPFRDKMLAALKGPPLSVYLCIALHCGGSEMTAYPSISTICKETGYGHTAVIAATQTLQKMGLVTITHREHENGDPDSNLYKVRGYATMGEGSTPSVQGVVHLVDGGSPPSVPKEESMEEESIQESGADAPDALPADEEWPEEPAPKEQENPAQAQIDRMREKFGPDWGTMVLNSRAAQAREGHWTIPKHGSLSTQCSVFKAATGYSPAQAVRGDIDKTVPVDDVDRLQFWYDVCHTWVMLGWSPKNVKGMLDFFVLDQLPSTGRATDQGKGGSSGPRQEQTISDDMVVIGVVQ